jgi:hypothetical protein
MRLYILPISGYVQTIKLGVAVLIVVVVVVVDDDDDDTFANSINMGHTLSLKCIKKHLHAIYISTESVLQCVSYQ